MKKITLIAKTASVKKFTQQHYITSVSFGHLKCNNGPIVGCIFTIYYCTCFTANKTKFDTLRIGITSRWFL